MVKESTLLSELGSLAGPERVLGAEDAAGYSVDGVSPAAVAAPASYEDAAEVLHYASTEGLAVIPWGAGTHMELGNLPKRYDIALSSQNLGGIVEHEPADLTVTCRAGATAGALGAALAGAGQMLPLGPLPGDPTIGGVLAANAWTALRGASGGPADFTIGMRVVTAEGRLTRAGGRVVKNVAGYDMCKLYIGSLGTLAFIVEASFKVRPLPKTEALLQVAGPDPEDLCALSREIERRGLSLWGSAIRGAPSPGLPRRYDMFLWLAGAEAGVKRSVQEIEAMARMRGAAAEEAPRKQGTVSAWWPANIECPAADAGLACRLSVSPTQLPEAVRALDGGAEARLTAWPSLGALRAEWPDDDAGGQPRRIASVREAARRLGGTSVVVRCDPKLKAEIDVFGEPPTSFHLMRSVKEQFDPRGTLSPGRFVGRL
jgi:glycolate oxidase FAD binding subunit